MLETENLEVIDALSEELQCIYIGFPMASRNIFGNSVYLGGLTTEGATFQLQNVIAGGHPVLPAGATL